MIGLGASMDPTTDIKQMRDALISRVDEQLAHVHEQIKSADEQLASMAAQVSRQERKSPRSYRRRSRDRWLRGIVGLLLAGLPVGQEDLLLVDLDVPGVVSRAIPGLGLSWHGNLRGLPEASRDSGGSHVSPRIACGEACGKIP